MSHTVVLVANAIAHGNSLLKRQRVEKRPQIDRIQTCLIQTNLKDGVRMTPFQVLERAQQLIISFASFRNRDRVGCRLQVIPQKAHMVTVPRRVNADTNGGNSG